MSGAASLTGGIRAFLQFCRIEKGLAANTIAAYRQDLTKFETFCGASVRPPGIEDLRAFVDSLYKAGLATRSIARQITTRETCTRSCWSRARWSRIR